MMRRLRLLLLICVWAVLSLSARAERLSVKTYTSADGLGSGFINYLMRDSRGFMWFCTRDGLSRFDGARFITYRVGDKAAQPGIEGITETREGSYWITTTSGLYRFRSGVASRPDSTNGRRPTLNAEFINGFRGPMLEDRDGILWCGDGALYRVEDNEGEVSLLQESMALPVPSNRRFRIITMTGAADGSLWLATTVGLGEITCRRNSQAFYYGPCDGAQDCYPFNNGSWRRAQQTDVDQDGWLPACSSRHWYASSRELMAFLGAIRYRQILKNGAFTELLLNTELAELGGDPGTTALSWEEPSEVSSGTILGKAGNLPLAGTAARAYIARMPHNCDVVVQLNTAWPKGSTTVPTIVKNTFQTIVP